MLANRKEQSVVVYTDSFQAYDPLDKDDVFDWEYVVHSDGEYIDRDVHVDTCESHASLTRRCFCRVEVSLKTD